MILRGIQKNSTELIPSPIKIKPFSSPVLDQTKRRLKTHAIIRSQPSRNPSISYEEVTHEEINDRFTTRWGGPLDSRAAEYAPEHSISYNIGGGRTFMVDPGTFILQTSKLCERRPRHETDTDLDTGTSILMDSDAKWKDATRSEKSKTSAEHQKTVNILGEEA